MTWREEYAVVIHRATRGLPNDLPLADRIKAVDAARPSEAKWASWPRKAWQAARRDYLTKFGYVPRTRANPGAGEQLPLFERSNT